MKEGDPASFTVLAFPDRVFHGVIAQVRQSPETVQNVVTCDVFVNVDNRDLALKPGMTASVRIVTDQRENVVRVPVVTGLDDDLNTEIVRGNVWPDDLVIIGEQHAAAPHAASLAPRPRYP